MGKPIRSLDGVDRGFLFMQPAFNPIPFMKHRFGFLIHLTCLLLGFLTMDRAQAGQVRGQVRDAVSKEPIEGAQVLLDVNSDGIAEHQGQTGLFGFYQIEGVAGGNYDLLGRHPGYLV